MTYLLDTNICIYLIKRRPAQVFRRLEEHQVGQIAISTVTYCELAFGVEHSSDPTRNGEALQQFLSPLEILPPQPEVAAIYGRIRAALKRAGRPIGPLDMLIAAHAIACGAVLVTNSEKEFSRVPSIKIENWARAA